jgi:5'-deoxynucleotidase YfbR-like HD superfamily hydrolase
MKTTELKQIIKEEIQSILNENTSKNILNKFQNRTGPEGLIISKLIVLEKVLKQLSKLDDIDGKKVIEMVLKTFDEIREI